MPCQGCGPFTRTSPDERGLIKSALARFADSNRTLRKGREVPVADMGRVSPTQDRWIDDDSRPGSSLGARRLDAQAPYAWLADIIEKVGRS